MTENSKRAMVFIDLGNVLNHAKQFRKFDAKLDFKDLVDTVVKDRKLVCTYVFDGAFDDRTDQGIRNELKKLGCEVKTRPCSYIGKQKEIDNEMTCEILSHAYEDSYDIAIIVSGDRDFRPVIEKIQILGKKAEVAGFSDCISEALSKSSDALHILDTLPLFYYAPYSNRYRGIVPKAS